MIRYALSAGAFENHITDGVAAAIRKSRFRNFEPYFGVFTSDDEPARLSAKLMRQLLREDVFHPASVHLPFYGDLSWDPSSLDEAERQDVSANFCGTLCQSNVRNIVWLVHQKLFQREIVSESTLAIT